MTCPDSSDDLRLKAKRALKAVIGKCTHLVALQPMLRDSPVKVQKYVLRQFAQLLPHDVDARREFVQSGGLQYIQVYIYMYMYVSIRVSVLSVCMNDVYMHIFMVINVCINIVQELSETGAGKSEEYILAINACYPPEIVEYYSPSYSKTLLDKLDEFKSPSLKTNV